MQVQPHAFTASGLIGTAAHSATIDSPLDSKPFQPAYMDNTAGVIQVPTTPQRFVGLAYDGFTKVVAYNGVDNTGDIVFVGGGPGTYGFNYEVNCQKGLYIEVTGTGSGTVWLA
jgi:hypothetical protein